MPAGRCQQAIHTNIMGFCGNLSGHLAIKGDTALASRNSSQQPIVVALTAPQPDTVEREP